MFEKKKLAKAISDGDANAVAQILDRHPELATKTYNGLLPLSRALFEDKMAICDMLVERFAPVTMAGAFGPNMLFDAVVYGRQAFLVVYGTAHPKLLRARDGGRNSLLHMAASNYNVEATRWLLEQGLNVEEMNHMGRTPLQQAELYGHEQVASLLRPFVEKVQMQHRTEGQKLLATQDGGLKWSKMDDLRIARVTQEPAIGYTVTTIFNFVTSERTCIYRNIQTTQESAETRPMNLADPDAELQAAMDALRRLGGTPPERVQSPVKALPIRKTGA